MELSNLELSLEKNTPENIETIVKNLILENKNKSRKTIDFKKISKIFAKHIDV